MLAGSYFYHPTQKSTGSGINIFSGCVPIVPNLIPLLSHRQVEKLSGVGEIK